MEGRAFGTLKVVPWLVLAFLSTVVMECLLFPARVFGALGSIFANLHNECFDKAQGLADQRRIERRKQRLVPKQEKLMAQWSKAIEKEFG